jgi:hypothetical protein
MLRAVVGLEAGMGMGLELGREVRVARALVVLELEARKAEDQAALELVDLVKVQESGRVQVQAQVRALEQVPVQEQGRVPVLGQELAPEQCLAPA